MRNMLTGDNPARAGEDSYGKSKAIMIPPKGTDVLLHLSENISDSFGGIKDRKYCLERLFSFHKFFYLFFRFLQCFVFLSVKASFHTSFQQFIHNNTDVSPEIPFSCLLLPPQMPPELQHRNPYKNLPCLSFLSHLRSYP